MDGASQKMTSGESHLDKRFRSFWIVGLLLLLVAYMYGANSKLQHQTKSLEIELAQYRDKLDKAGQIKIESNGHEQAKDDYLPSLVLFSEHADSIIVHGGMFLFIMSGLLYQLKEELSILIKVLITGSEKKDNTAVSQEYKRSKYSANEYFFYRMDWWLSHYSFAKPLSLLWATYVVIFIGGVCRYLVSSDSETLGESMWTIWTFVADPGTHADENDMTSRFIAFLVSIAGMLIFALMIGIIADGVSDLLDDMKQGKSRVIESGHTLVLGWSDKTLPTIVELSIANESEGGGVVVVLAERSKEEMESELRLQMSSIDLRGTVVVCRSGSPILMSDLLKVSANTAKSVIVLSDPEVDADESDAHSVRVVMSLTGIQVSCHMVVEMCDIDNRELVMLVGKGMVETVVSHDIIGRLMIQCARQPGLAQILEQILGFDGDEFYIEEWPCLVGKTFREVAFLFDAAIPIGVKPADPERATILYDQFLESVATEKANSGIANSPQSTDPLQSMEESKSCCSEQINSSTKLSQAGKPISCGPRITLLNPPNDYVIQKGDKIIVLAEDDDTYEAKREIESTDVMQAFEDCKTQKSTLTLEGPEKMLFCGWRRDIDDMIVELDKIVEPGSELTLMSTVAVESRLAGFRQTAKLQVGQLQNLTLKHQVGNQVIRRHLESLSMHQFDSILILADEALETNMQTSDSRSLASLLLIRDIIKKSVAAERSASVVASDIVAIREADSFAGEDEDFESKDSSRNCDERGINEMPPPGKESLVTGSRKIVKHDSRYLRCEKNKQKDNPVIISEILDSRTKSLISVAQVSDYVMSNEIVASAMAMVSEDRSVNYILSELLSSCGNEIVARSCLRYCQEGECLSFWEIISRARKYREVSIGYKSVSEERATMNPRNKHKKRKWVKGDLIVVLATE